MIQDQDYITSRILHKHSVQSPFG